MFEWILFDISFKTAVIAVFGAPFPTFFLSVNFLRIYLDTGLCEQPTSLAVNSWALYLMEGVSDRLLDIWKVSSPLLLN